MKTDNGLLKKLCGVGTVVLLTVAFSAAPLVGESLWEPGFSGYVSPGAAVDAGDLLLIDITPTTELSLESSHLDSEEARISFSGGDGGGIFDFLPEGASGSDRSIEEEDAYGLSTRMAVRVTGKSEDGLLRLRGSRSVEINGLRERIELVATVSPSSLRRGEAIPFAVLADAELVYTGVGYGREGVLGPEDLRRPVDEERNQEAPAGQEEAQTAQTGGGETGVSSAGESGGYRLSEEKKEELLLRYINRFIDVLFSK